MQPYRTYARVLPGVAAGGSTGPQPITFASSLNLVNYKFSQPVVKGTGERWGHYLPQACTEIYFSWCNWVILNSSTGEINNLNDNTINSSVAECNGVVVQLTFNGSTTVALPGGANDVRCDKLTPAMFGFSGGVFPAGTIIAVKTVHIAPQALAFYAETARTIADFGNGVAEYCAWFDPAQTTLTNPLGPGNFTGFTGSAPTNRGTGWQPFVIGRLAAASPVEWFSGDSETMPSNAMDTTARRDGRGWAQIVSSNLGRPCANFGITGSQAIAGVNDPKLAYWMGFANRGNIFYCTNDYDPSGGNVSLAVGQARVSALGQKMKTAGMTTVRVRELMCKTTSTNGYIDELNQSYAPNWAPGGIATQFNASLPLPNTDIKIPSQSMRGTDVNKWKAPGYALDGIHPTLLGVNAMVTDAQPVLAAS